MKNLGQMMKQIQGMQSQMAFCPFFTERPSSIHFGNVAMGPGGSPGNRYVL